MSDDLRARGIQVLGELVETWDQEAWSAVKAWERDCIAAYPRLKDLGPFTRDEREYAEGLVQQRAPNFSLVHPSTYFLDDKTIETTGVENGVRLYRLQHSNVKPKNKAGRKPFDDNEIEVAIEKVVEKQSKPNKHKALIEVLDRMDLDNQKYERTYERLKKKIYFMEK